ncbi:hypothetical protein D3C75_705530 [compost metagenome]
MVKAVLVLLALFRGVAHAYDDFPVLMGIIGDRHIPFVLGHVLAGPVFHHQDTGQHHRSAVWATIEPFHFQAQFLVFQHRRPLVGEQPLHHAFRTVLLLDHFNAVIAGRQQAERKHPVHGVDDGVVFVHQDVSVVEAVFAGDPPVAETGAVHAERHRIVIEHARRSRPHRMRELLAAFWKTERQVVSQRWYILVGEAVLADEDEDHAVDLVHRVGGDTGGADQLVVRVGDDGHQLAAFEVEGETVIPARDGALAKAGRLLRQAHTTVQTLVLEGINLTIDPA